MYVYIYIYDTCMEYDNSNFLSHYEFTSLLKGTHTIKTCIIKTTQSSSN